MEQRSSCTRRMRVARALVATSDMPGMLPDIGGVAAGGPASLIAGFAVRARTANTS